MLPALRMGHVSKFTLATDARRYPCPDPLFIHRAGSMASAAGSKPDEEVMKQIKKRLMETGDWER